MAATSEAPRTPALKTKRPTLSPSSGVSALLISPNAGKARRTAAGVKRRRRRDQHGARQALREYGAETRIPARGRKIARAQLFVRDGRLLVEDHPGIEGRADDGREQEHEVAVAERQIERVPRHRREARMRRPGDGEEGEFKEADDDRRPLHAPVGAGGDDGEQSRRRERQRQRARKAIEVADSRHAGEFGDQRADHRRRQARRR
jgi:hypothetical protein